MLVALGGAVGCLARTALEGALGEWRTVLVGQVAANVTGAFVLAYLVARLGSSRSPYATSATLLLGTGLLGAWTTYSGLALQTLASAQHAGLLAGLLVLAGSVTAGVVAAVAGLALGARGGPAPGVQAEVGAT